jgi:hypothetical protein
MKDLEELAIFTFFKKNRIVHVGDVGVYKDVLSVGTTNEGSHTLYYDFYVKVRALGVYENLIEIEVIDISTINACSNDISNLITKNIPKYVKPKHIKWAI